MTYKSSFWQTINYSNFGHGTFLEIEVKEAVFYKLKKNHKNQDCSLRYLHRIDFRGIRGEWCGGGGCLQLPKRWTRIDPLYESILLMSSCYGDR